ncbi:AraC family transcriptional regulator [uncultured Aquitalea sp.]|uniref:AraC family transcriptional regulator n=1 Tax=uncultured Aquitalea sp. TaxID=540272 RepID=UPI0025FD17E9|nr:AraC family transcriptional regulator [uncultured Aquitalea sp.]
MTAPLLQPGLSLRSYPGECHSHQHDHHQLVLPVRGCLELEVDGRGGRVDAGSLAVIEAGASHGFAASGDNRFLVADVPLSMSGAWLAAAPFRPLSPPLQSYLVFLRDMAGQTATPACQLSMLALLLQLLPGGDAAPDPRLRRACAWLEARLAEDCKLADLARDVHLSPRQLSELFRRQLGVSPGQYLQNLRMDKARRLLESTRLPVQQVAEACGYGSLAAFSDRFARHTGQSPTHYRRHGKTERRIDKD